MNYAYARAVQLHTGLSQNHQEHIGNAGIAIAQEVSRIRMNRISWYAEDAERNGRIVKYWSQMITFRRRDEDESKWAPDGRWYKAAGRKDIYIDFLQKK